MRNYLVFFLLVSLLCGCASTEDVTMLSDRVGALERQTLSTETSRKSAQSQFEDSYKKTEQQLRNQYADQQASIDRLREELQLLNGKFEELDYSLKQKSEFLSADNQKIEDELTKLNDRVSRLEQYINLEPSEKAAMDKKAQASDNSKGQLSESELYIQGKQAFDRGDFEKARLDFKTLLEKYPKSENADNAQFWIGEIYYQGKWYEKAILEYQRVIEKYPKGNKVASALLKQGLAFHNIDDNANARLILNELIKKYPGSNEAKIAQEKLKIIK